MKIFQSKNNVFKTPSHLFQTVWKPNLINGMIFWGNNDKKNIVTENNKVLKWKDISGCLNNGTQTNLNIAPVFKENITNGHNALYFENNNNIEIVLKLNHFTVITVLNIVNNSFLYEFSDSTISNTGFFISGDDYDSIATSKYGYGISTRKNTLNDHWLSDGNDYKMINHQYGGTHYSHNLFINNNYQSLSYQNDDDPGLLLADDIFRIGTKGDGTDGIVGYVYELLIYDKALDLQERTKVANYLNTKYSMF